MTGSQKEVWTMRHPIGDGATPLRNDLVPSCFQETAGKKKTSACGLSTCSEALYPLLLLVYPVN